MRNLKLILLSLFYVLNISADTLDNISISDNSNNPTSEINKLLILGDFYKNNNNVLEADESYKNALNLAIINNSNELIYDSYERFGLLYERIGNYNLSTDNYLKALKIADRLLDVYKQARIYNHLGNIFILEKEYSKAYEYFMKSATIDKKLKNNKGIAGTYNNIGEVYRFQKQYEKALEYYNKAITINKEMANNQWLGINYENIGSVYYVKGEKDKALDYYFLALNHSELINDFEGIASINNNIGELYLFEAKYDLALKHLLVAYENAKKISLTLFIKNSSKNLSELYSRINNYKSAYNYFKIYEESDKILNENLKTKRIAQIVAEYQLDKKNKENEFLKKENEFDDLKVYALSLIIILIFVIGILMITKLRTRHKKTKELLKKNELIIKTEKILAETQLKNVELEKKQLNQKLEYQRKELVNFALHIIHKNDFLINIKDELKLIKSNNKLTSKQIRNLLLKINQSQKVNADLEGFQQNVERVNKDFFDTINKLFPDLTKNEKRLAAMLRIDLSSKEIASLNNISIKAVEMGRYRLRKKLNLDTNISLTEFFKNIT
jgi:tetratricopeptide (TPR) repeat protein